MSLLNKRKQYSLEEKEKLGKLAEKYKNEYNLSHEEQSKLPKEWDRRRKQFVKKTSSQSCGGYLARAVRETFPNLKDANHDNPDLKNAIKVAARALEVREKKKIECDLDLDVSENEDSESRSRPSSNKRKCREPGAGRKSKAPEVRNALFEWFVDVRGTLKGRLPLKMFRSMAQSLHNDWLKNQDDETKLKDDLKFTRPWIKSWCKEFNVSLLKPNKRFQISQEDRVLRIIEFLKNIIRVRYFFNHHHKKEPTIINGDQMPLHRNESAGQKTLSLKNNPVFVKENYMLSRERATVYTQVSSEGKLIPEFVFKGKGTRTKLNPPEGMNVQWAEKGSYRLPNMLNMVSKLPNRYNLFSNKDYAIYVLDDYSVHLQPELRESLLKRGYILIIIGGGVTGDIQVNDTHYHHKIKQQYRDLECNLMIDKLRSDPSKVPAPTRDEMMEMLNKSWTTVIDTTDPILALKNNFILNALDGSEDFLVSESIKILVGKEIVKFREELLKTPPPKSLKDLLKTITPPKGIKRRQTQDDKPDDEGQELMDCEGEEMAQNDDDDVVENEDDDVLVVENEDDDEHGTDTESIITNKRNEHMTDLPAKSKDEKLNHDMNFINDISSIIREYEGKTSTLFLPYISQIKGTVSTAKRSLKKRLHAEQSSYEQVRHFLSFPSFTSNLIER